LPRDIRDIHRATRYFSLAAPLLAAASPEIREEEEEEEDLLAPTLFTPPW
jgi:hypothetical protein